MQREARVILSRNDGDFFTLEIVLYQCWRGHIRWHGMRLWAVFFI
jgi:hypothetical protein